MAPKIIYLEHLFSLNFRISLFNFDNRTGVVHFFFIFSSCTLCNLRGWRIFGRSLTSTYVVAWCHVYILSPCKFVAYSCSLSWIFITIISGFILSEKQTFSQKRIFFLCDYCKLLKYFSFIISGESLNSSLVIHRKSCNRRHNIRPQNCFP